jgi:RNA polymerase sigma factor (sigma-70 family)
MVLERTTDNFSLGSRMKGMYVSSQSDGHARNSFELENLSSDILEIARRCALRRHVLGEDSEDCALEFVARVLDQPDRFLLPDPQIPGAYLRAWIVCCADNWAKDFHRKRQVIQKYEEAWPQTSAQDGDVWQWDCPDCTAMPERMAFQGEFWEQISKALAELDAFPRKCFREYYLEGKCLAHIAEECERTPNAIKMILARARKRIHAFLQRQGWTAEELFSLVVVSDALLPCKITRPLAHCTNVL